MEMFMGFVFGMMVTFCSHVQRVTLSFSQISYRKYFLTKSFSRTYTKVFINLLLLLRRNRKSLRLQCTIRERDWRRKKIDRLRHTSHTSQHVFLFPVSINVAINLRKMDLLYSKVSSKLADPFLSYNSTKLYPMNVSCTTRRPVLTEAHRDFL